MAVVGFNFTKISVERKEMNETKLNINNNVSIKSVDKIDFNFGKAKQDGVRFLFEYTSKYEPDYASMVFGGDLLYLGSEQGIKDILEEWTKKKTVPKEVMVEVLNGVLSRCNVEAIMLARDLNLPSPYPLPKVTAGNEEAKEEKKDSKKNK